MMTLNEKECESIQPSTNEESTVPYKTRPFVSTPYEFIQRLLSGSLLYRLALTLFRRSRMDIGQVLGGKSVSFKSKLS